MKFITTLFILVVSAVLPSTLAAVSPLTKRHYIPELKAALSQIDEQWKDIEKKITGIPKEGATV